MKIQDQEWHKETAKALRRYPMLEKRVEIINLKLLREVCPSTRVTANLGMPTGKCYQDGNGEIKEKQKNNVSDFLYNQRDLEAELEECRQQISEIDLAIQVLDDEERQIIRLKYFNSKKDYQIYQEYKPMASNTYYKILNGAIEKMAKCLGYLGLK